MIRASIRTKLALLLSSLSLLLVAIILLLVQASFDRGFHHYLNEAHQARMQQVARAIEEVARDPEQWQRLQRDRRFWFTTTRSFYREPLDQPPGDEPRLRPLPFDARPADEGPNGEHHPRPVSLNRPPPLWLLDAEQRPLIGRMELPEDLVTLPIQVDGNLRGYLAWQPVQARDFDAEALFAQQQHRLFIIIAVAALALCLLLSWPLSQYLVRPIQRLSHAMQILMQRRYDVSVPVRSRDELGDLAQDFNVMARTLAEHDHSQRQWLADISHELRTPLGVLKGELEAIEDGVIPLDQAAVSSLQDEVRQLNGLVDDLHQLAVTDLGALRYRFEPVDLAVLLHAMAPRLTQQLQWADLRLELDAPASGVTIAGDTQRLEQLISNLAQNSIRYTNPGGAVRISLLLGNPVQLRWEDTAPGVEAEDMPHLFERFYRVDKSRQRTLGGSGLGLAIVANIVSAHEGSIHASASELGGLCVQVELPLRQAG